MSCTITEHKLTNYSVLTRVVVVVLMMCTGSSAYSSNTSDPVNLAQAASQNNTFHAQGIQAFKDGDYQQAIQLLKKALTLDSENPKLIFNLASAYYKAEQFDDAFYFFSRLINYPAYKPMAFYHLGLIDIKREHYSDAKYWFQKCLTATSNQQLATLSRRAIQRIDDSRKKQQEINRQKWNVSATVVAGYDDNVSLANLDIDNTVQKKDSFLNIAASASGYLTGDIRNGFHAMLSYNNRTYHQESNYDYQIATAQVAYDLRLGKYYNRLFSQYRQIDLGGDSFQTIVAAGLQSQFLIAGQRWLKFNYQFSQYDADLQRYNYLNGDQHLLLAELTKKTPDSNYRIKYQIEINNRDDLTVGNQYFDASPVRHTLSGRLRLINNYYWDLSTELSFRKSIYDRNNVFFNGVNLQRDDERTTLAITSNIWVTQNWTLRASYQYTENDANIPVYSYNRNLASVGVIYKY